MEGFHHEPPSFLTKQMSSLPLLPSQDLIQIPFLLVFFVCTLEANYEHVFQTRALYWLCLTLAYVIACKSVNSHCALCQFHTWAPPPPKKALRFNESQQGTRWSHGSVWVSESWSWFPPGAALVQLGWLQIEGMWPSDWPEAFATIWWMPPDHPCSTQAEPFFF